MSELNNKLNNLIDILNENLNSNLNSFLLARTILQIGKEKFEDFNENIVLQFPISSNVSLEPIPIKELSTYSNVFPSFIVEVFHGRSVFYWQEFLTNIFSLYVELHFNEIRKFHELKKKQIQFDFNNEGDFKTQIKDSLIRNFDFERYQEKIRIINNVCKSSEPSISCEDELVEIYKNIIIRNCLHHKNSLLTEDQVQLLGQTTIQVLNDEGKNMTILIGDKVNLSFPEFHKFTQCMKLVSQRWRK